MKSVIQRVLRAAIVFSPAGRRTVLSVVCCALTIISPAVETKVIRDDSFQNFNQGESTGTELLSLGRLKIAPKVNRIEKGEEGVAWDVAVDPYDGNVFYSTGHNGKVYRHQPGGKTELWADLTEVEAISVAVDATGGVLIGASPGGKIYRVVKSGKPEVFFDTKEQYIWDMIFDRNGVLYAATGPNGKIYRIRGQNNGEVYYDSDATNVMALAFNSEGRLLAATQGKAYILRVDTSREAYVLYSATEDECRSLTVDSEGNIYAAINGARSSTSDSSDKDDKGTSIFGTSGGSSSASPSPTPSPTPKPADAAGSSSGFSLFSSGTSSGQSSVVQIQPSGFASNFWTAPEGPIQSVIPNPFGEGLLIAAGKKGKIYSLGKEANYSVVGDVADANVLALAAYKDRVYLTTANKGSLYEMANTSTREGIFASRAMNAGGTVHWGNIDYDAEETSGTEVLFETRSGNTSEPDDKSWSPWTAATRVAPKIRRVESPVAQYLQYRLTLRAAADGTSPVVDKVQAYYVQKNAAPVIRSIDVEKAGDPGGMSSLAILSSTRRATPTPQSGSSTSSSSSSAGSNPFSSSSSMAGLSSLMSSMSGRSGSGTDGQDSRASGSSISVPANSQKVNITWNVSDPNGDKLRSKLFFKGEDESEWKLIEKELTVSNFVFSTEAIPDGKYRFKVVVTDSAENQETSASTVSLTGQLYVVDNSPPDILKLTGTKVGPDEYEITAAASDKTSIIAAAEFNIDAAKEWRAAFPEDGIFDFNQETFRWRVKPEEEKKSTEHTLSLRVYDREGNSRVEKVLLK